MDVTVDGIAVEAVYERAIDAARQLPANRWSEAMVGLAASLLERRT